MLFRSIIRAFNSTIEISSLLSLPAPTNGTTPPVQINALSDGTFRLIKNEILDRYGNISTSVELRESPLFAQYEQFTRTLAELRDEIQQEFKDVVIGRENLLKNTPDIDKESGLLISEKITVLSTNEATWEQLGSLREGLKFRAISNATVNQSNTLERLRWRTLQTLYSALDNGFFVYAGENRFLVKERWSKLENGEAPELNHIVTKTELESFLGLTFTQSDLKDFPIPPGILNLTLSILE